MRVENTASEGGQVHYQTDVPGVVLVGERDVPRLLDVLTGEVEEGCVISTGGRTFRELILGHGWTEVTKLGPSHFLR